MSPRRIDFLDPDRRPASPRASQGAGAGRGSSVRQRRNRTPREHGWARAEDKRAQSSEAKAAGRRGRRASGLPLLLGVALGLMTFVGIARVRARLDVLALADEVTALTAERDELLDRKRRLEAERAYLRHPERVRDRATAELGMVQATPERIQTIEVVPPREESQR